MDILSEEDLQTFKVMELLSEKYSQFNINKVGKQSKKHV
jgi:hypothetical protein